MKKRMQFFAMVAAILWVGSTASTCSLLNPVFAPLLTAENASSSLNQQIVVAARLRRMTGRQATGGQRLRTYLWRDDRWTLLETVQTNEQGQAQLTIPPGVLPAAGKYFIGWRHGEDDSILLSVSTVTVTQ